MATPNEKLAASLTVLRQLQKGGRRVFQTKEITRVHRDRLLKNGFIQEVMKGWLISATPGAVPSDSTPWYASFWEFCARYCTGRFGDVWYLSPEQSLLLHAENTVIPKQLIVNSPKGANNKLELLFGTSIFDLRVSRALPARNIVLRDGLRLFTAAAALTQVPESFLARHPIESEVILSGLGDVSELLGHLLEAGQPVVAGRLARAFRRVGRSADADEIVTAMKAVGYDVRDTNADLAPLPDASASTATSPIVGRLQAMWKSMRGPVLDIFPKPPGLPRAKVRYLKAVDDIYRTDAYHSLSIEGYLVSPELIERVRSGQWDPSQHAEDRQGRDALAARGYWQAFQIVKRDIAKILDGSPPGRVARSSHRDWYRELFAPCVTAGLVPASALAGYRADSVFLRTSRYVPPRREAVPDAMKAFFDLLEEESEAGVRAVLGHWLFGYIHPYPDGNGRMARFLMNVMFASGGYPWTIIRVEDRAAYLAALDSASIDLDIRPFSQLLARRVRQSA